MNTRILDIAVARVYDAPREIARYRILVDRLWPRGIKRADLRPDEWLKNVAPSDELRRWFNHDPDRWEEFKRRYFEELDGHPETWAGLVKTAATKPILLLYAARDERHNNAVALKEFLDALVEDEADA